MCVGNCNTTGREMIFRIKYQRLGNLGDQGKDYNNGRNVRWLSAFFNNCKMDCCLCGRHDSSESILQNPIKSRESSNGEFDRLIRDFETCYVSSSDASGKATFTTVKKMVSAYEMKYCLSPGKPHRLFAEAKNVANGNARREGGELASPSNSIPTTGQAEKTSDEGSNSPNRIDEGPGTCRIVLDDAKESEDAGEKTSANVEGKVGDVEEKSREKKDVANRPEDAEEMPKERLFDVGAHDAEEDDHALVLSRSESEDKRTTKRFLAMINSASPKSIRRRFRLWKRNNSWRLKRRGLILFHTLCDEQYSTSPEDLAEDLLKMCENDFVANLDELDNSGNSYKNLEMDMFDFEDDGQTCFGASMAANESPQKDAQDESAYFLPYRDKRNATHAEKDGGTFLGLKETDRGVTQDEEEAVPGPSSAVDDSRELLADACPKWRSKPERAKLLPALYKRLPRKTLKKLLSLLKAKCLTKRSEPTEQFSSPDSGYSEPSSTSSASSRDLNNCRAVTPSSRPCRCSCIKKWKRRLTLNKVSREEVAFAVSATKTPRRGRSECRDVDSPPGDATGCSKPRIVPSWLHKRSHQADATHPLGAMTMRTDEIAEKKQIERPDLQRLDFANGWVVPCNCSELRSRSALLFQRIARGCNTPKSAVLKKPVVCNVGKIVSDFTVKSLPSVHSSVQSECCFATVRPRRFCMRPETALHHKRDIMKRASM